MYIARARDGAPVEGEGFAELSAFPSDTVARLTKRACAEFGWGVPTQARLYLVPSVERARELQLPGASAADILAGAALFPGDSIAPGSWLLARVSPPAAAAVAVDGAGALDAGRVVALLEQLLAGQARDRAEHARDAERAYFEQLYIRPVFSPPSSSGSSNRSPRDEHRVALKIETIDYYGLWASGEADKTARTVRTMLASSAAETEPAPVPFREAILAHIWPSALATCAQNAGGLFGLPEAFHVTPRNFLILRKPVERAFDVDVLLLLPRRTAGGEQQVVTVGLGALRGGLRLFNSVGSLGARMATVGASLPARS